MAVSRFSIFFFILALTTAEVIKHYEKVCSPISRTELKLLKELTTNEPEPRIVSSLPVDLPGLISKAGKIGEGTSGKVVAVDLPLKSYPKVAVKHLDATSTTNKEIFFLNKLGEMGFAPRLLACQHGPYAVWPVPIYLVQSYADWDLESQDARKAFQKLDIPTRLGVYKRMLEAIKAMWDIGYLHNDVKPANYVADKTFRRVYLIDFGSASGNAEDLPRNGSPPFVSPGKFTGDKASDKHDLYSWAMTVAFMEAPVTKLDNSDLIRDPDFSFMQLVRMSRRLDDSCFVDVRSAACKNALMNNAIKILNDRGLGPYAERTDRSKGKPYNSLANLIVEIIEFDGFQDDIYGVVGVLAELMIKSQNEINDKLLTSKIQAKQNQILL